MADIFDEINTELRRDKIRDVWDKYGLYVVGLAVAIILFVAGSSGYSSYVTGRNEAASARYDILLQDIAAAPPEMQAQALTDFMSADNGAYGTLAGFLAAQKHIGNNQLEEGVALYDQIARNADLPIALRDYASVSAAYALIGTRNTAELEQRIGRLLGDNHSFRHAAREIIALGYFIEQDYLSAREIIETALQDETLPPEHGERLFVLSEIVKAHMATK